MTTLTREEVWNIWRYHPAAVGRMCGFRDLTDELHGRWMQHIIFGADDYTLQAHRLSYKSSCLSVALAMWCVLNHGKTRFSCENRQRRCGKHCTGEKVFANEAFATWRKSSCSRT